MQKNRLMLHLLLLLSGVLLLAAGIFGFGESAKTVSGLCIGIGAGLAGMNVAHLIIGYYYKKHPDAEKQSDIEAQDERNVAITDKAKAKAFDLTRKLLIIVPFLLILADSPLWITLAAVGVYTFSFGLQIYFTMRLSREM